MKLPQIKIPGRGSRTPAPGAQAGPFAPGSSSAPPGPPPPPGETIDPAELRELRQQRDRLREKFTIMQSDLGGAFYEMAIRDHVRMDILTQKAAELQKVDAELLVFERIVAMQGTDVAGFCASCRSSYQYGQQFCAQCGTPVGNEVPRA